MKNLILTAVFLFTTVLLSGQSEKWRQKNARINFVFTPQVEYVKIAGAFNPAFSFSGAIAFNNTYFVGCYLTKKIIRNYDVFEPTPADLDADFQHGGVEFLYSMRLGLYRTKGGHYVRPKIRIVFGARLGAGLVWLDDINKERATESDYFGYIEPMVGVAYPLNDFITVHGGACFTTTVKIQKLDTYFQNSDFMGPGGYIALKFSLFR